MKVTVLTGGTSSERDVALASAVQVVAALRKCGHEVAVVDTARGYIPEAEEARELRRRRRGGPAVDREAPLPRARRSWCPGLGDLQVVRNAEVIFLALHGGTGEDGTLQSLLEIIGVPYTGSGPMASGIAMDKDISKRLFKAAGVATADWAMAPISLTEVQRRFGWPVVVKPSKQGSTVGLSVVRKAGELEPAVALAAKYDDEVMIEAFVPGRELTVGVLDDQALAVGEIIPQHEIFDYECKYTPGHVRGDLPGRLVSRADRGLPAALPGRPPRAEAGRLQPGGLSLDTGGLALLFRGEHPARHDRHEPAPAVGPGGGDRVPRTLRPDLPLGADPGVGTIGVT